MLQPQTAWLAAFPEPLCPRAPLALHCSPGRATSVDELGVKDPLARGEQLVAALPPAARGQQLRAHADERPHLRDENVDLRTALLSMLETDSACNLCFEAQQAQQAQQG